MSGVRICPRAEQVAGHMKVGRDYERAGNLGSARQHYPCALQRATRAVLEVLEGLNRNRRGSSR